jgi:formylmethanofuran dehydrogenase subunit B
MTERTLQSVTCLGCGCACDDIDVAIRDGRIVETRHACDLGAAWFAAGATPCRVRVEGADAPIERALDAATRLLARASRPLVYLAPDLSCDAQREAIAIADALRAALDSVTSSGALASTLAAQERGRVGATLGEIRNRADLIVFWGVDPRERYPRYPTRYAPDPVGVHVAEGRRSRTVVAVDIGDAIGPADADLRVRIEPSQEVAVLTALAAAVRGPALPEDNEPWTTARTLAPCLTQAHYAVIVTDAEISDDGRDAGRAAALITLAQALNGVTRAAVSTLRGGGNRSGADAVMTAQTGYPCAVDFARGYPRYRPYDGSAAARLARGDVDAVLVTGAVKGVPDAVARGFAQLPCAVIGPGASDSALARAQAVIDTGIAGIHEGGTAVRMDDVPLPLRASLDGAVNAVETLRTLRARVLSRRA